MELVVNRRQTYILVIMFILSMLTFVTVARIEFTPRDLASRHFSTVDFIRNQCRDRRQFFAAGVHVEKDRTWVDFCLMENGDIGALVYENGTIKSGHILKVERLEDLQRVIQEWMWERGFRIDWFRPFR